MSTDYVTSEVSEDLEEFFEEPLEELDCDLDRMADAIIAGDLGEEPELCTARFRAATVGEGRLMALFSHCSIMFGLPVFLVPMVLRDNAFALHHAKAAGVIYLICTAILVAALTNCAVFLPLVFLCYIPALIGIYRAAAGVEAGTAALGAMGERIFQRIEVKE